MVGQPVCPRGAETRPWGRRDAQALGLKRAGAGK